MVEVLIRAVSEPKHFMHWLVEVTADTCTTHAGSFGFQIEHLTYHAGFPEQARIEPGTVSFQRFLVFGDHPKTEAPVAGNVLETRHLPGSLLSIRFDEVIQFQLRRTPNRALPLVSFCERCFERGSLRRVACQDVQARGKIIDSVNNDRQVDVRLPGKSAEGNSTWDWQRPLREFGKTRLG